MLHSYELCSGRMQLSRALDGRRWAANGQARRIRQLNDGWELDLDEIARVTKLSVSSPRRRIMLVGAKVVS